MKRRVILDTDIGTNVDDLLALALILASPELALAAVTTVYGDVRRRAQIVLKLLTLRGTLDVPVAMGAAKPLTDTAPVYWAGHEGEGLLGPKDGGLTPLSEDAVELIIRTVMADPGQVALVAIGPLTNVARALLREPRLAQSLAELIVMGGVIGGVHALHLPWVDHNFGSDPEAARIVLASGAPVTIVPLDVTRQVCIRESDVARLAALGDRFHNTVADQITRYPRYARQGWTYLNDPLAVAALITPSLLTFSALHAVVETDGRHTAGKLLLARSSPDTPPTAQVTLAVQAARAERFIIDRLLR